MKKKVILIVVGIGIIFIICGICISIFYSKPENVTTNTTVDKKENNLIDSNYYKKNKDGSLVNTSEKVLKEHSSGNLTIENMDISISADNQELADYSFVVKNTGTENYSLVDMSVIFIFSNGTKFNVSLSPIENLSSGESVKVTGKSFIDIIASVDYEFSYEASE